MADSRRESDLNMPPPPVPDDDPNPSRVAARPKIPQVGLPPPCCCFMIASRGTWCPIFSLASVFRVRRFFRLTRRQNTPTISPAVKMNPIPRTAINEGPPFFPPSAAVELPLLPGRTIWSEGVYREIQVLVVVSSRATGVESGVWRDERPTFCIGLREDRERERER